jgi:hypothetical protein
LLPLLEEYILPFGHFFMQIDDFVQTINLINRFRAERRRVLCATFGDHPVFLGTNPACQNINKKTIPQIKRDGT